MPDFSPRSVPPKNWRAWFREALDLATRRAAFNVTLGLACAGVLALFWTLANQDFGFLLAPALAGLFAIVAHSTDEAIPVWRHLCAKCRAVGRLVLATAAFWLAFVAAVMLLAAINLMTHHMLGVDVSEVELPPQPEGVPFVPLANYGFALFVLGFFMMVAPWLSFLVPLLVCADLPLMQALRLADDAYDANPFVWRVSATAGVLLALAGLFNGIVAVVTIPIVGAMMYVAYRDVFLGLPPQTQPQAAPLPAGQIQPAAPAL